MSVKENSLNIKILQGSVASDFKVGC